MATIPPFTTFPKLAELRAQLTEDVFEVPQRRTTVRQISAMLDGVYAHLPQKRAMYAFDPIARLRVLDRELPGLTDAQFQAELQRILIGLRDLHTLYTLPRPYRNLASIGILIERCFEGETPRWIVSKVAEGLGAAGPVEAPFGRGVEVTHWNGVPIAVAVALHADDEPGANAAARTARGIERMTQRSLALSPMPDEDWVDLEYLEEGQPGRVRLPWRVVDNRGVLDFDEEAALRTGAADLALDVQREFAQRAKKALFTAGAPERADEPDPFATPRKHELRARTVTTAHGVFGHLRIFTFKPVDNPDVADDIAEFLAEVRRLVGLLPQDGLILDVRDNGGGAILASEALLQYFTPKRITSSPLQLVATPATADLCAKAEQLFRWRSSVDQALATGSQYSAALAPYKATQVNQIGQIYHGPVVLVTDALCYSATDTFAALFQDHDIGTVLGVDSATGAGGANVWALSDLLLNWPQAPVEPLPGGADLRVALRRSLRVGDRAGQPIEDLGVEPKVLHRLTRRDLLDGNLDLMEAAGAELAKGTRRTLTAEITAQAAASATLQVQTGKISSLDVYVNERPVATLPVSDGEHAVEVPLAGTGSKTIRLEGFSQTQLVAARNVIIAP
jgi:Peptidase family S41